MPEQSCLEIQIEDTGKWTEGRGLKKSDCMDHS